MISTAALCERVHARLGRRDLTVANIEAALEKISCREVRRVLRGQLEAGKAHYVDASLLLGVPLSWA